MATASLYKATARGTSAFAGAFGRAPAGARERESERIEAALRHDGAQVRLRRGEALSLGAAGNDDDLELVEGCVCALVGSLYDLDTGARELGLPPDASAEQVAVATYRRHGTAAPDRLRGDYALLVWDEASGRGLLAIDHLGGGAIFLHGHSGRLTFASELRHLLPLLERRPAPDPVAMVHWLALGGPPSGHSFYEGVTQLPGGHCVELERDGWRIVRYWRPRYRQPERVDGEQAADRLRDALMRSVARRCGSDEPIGVMLSGGIDSAAVAGLAVACKLGPVRAYSATFPDHPAIDESELIELIASELAIPSWSLPVRGGSVVSGALRYTREWEAPASSPNLFFWSALLRRAAQDGVSVMLDGEGGDALFWLSPYLLADRLVRGRLLSAVSLARRFPADAGHVLPSVAARLIRDWGLKGATPYRVHRLRQRLRGYAAFAPPWFTAHSARLRFETDPALDWKRTGAPRWWSSLLQEATGIGSRLVHDATRRRNGAVGLRASHPLLDVDVVELVLALSPELAFDPGSSRPLLRESVRGLVPERVRARRSKSSFDALFHELLAGPDLPYARALLLAADAEVNAFVDPTQVRALFDVGFPRAPGALQRWALDVWRLLTAEIWLRHQAGRPLAENC